MTTTDRSHKEQGSAVLELPLVVGFVLIPFLILVLTIPTWIERQTAARDAASEASRAVILSGGDTDAADRIVAQIEVGYGLPANTMSVTYSGLAVPGEEFTAAVQIRIPALVLPVFGGTAETTWTSSHTERYPDYAATPK